MNDTFHVLEHDVELTIDKKDLLIVQDGKIKVAEPVDSKPQQQYDSNGEAIKATGTWTKEEHERFLKAMEMYPKGPWKAIAGVVSTRTVRQTQTHARKYREKIARRMRGLRNRNGTLQQPPTMPHSSSFQHPSTYYVSSHRVAPMGQASIMRNQHGHLPSMSHATLSPHSTQTPSPTAPGGSMLALLNDASCDTAYDNQVFKTEPSMYMGGHCYPAQQPLTSTSPNSVAMSLSSSSMTTAMYQSTSTTHAPTPDFNESMDFFMHMYSHNPEQLAPRREYY
ncbi:TPA: hypothetical protein N0F65_007534 [Lagenidium giganteum]|uniref:Uncharacterized protein n=1 Tax=Lagenidium giganteum TaxID=4803 RepID=A0AAV2ZLI6_9STRA|nr:TPA: hypothetical protein N0F65_007534 [Lagenidium giganteum]